MTKRLIIKAAVLIPVFVAALLFFNWQFNSRNEVVVLQMAQPSFPTVSFNAGEYEINNVNGYAEKMDITGVRDTITPTEGRHTVDVYVHPYGNSITSAALKVYDIKGERVLQSSDISFTEDEDGNLTSELQFDDTWSSEREAVMEITLTRENDEPVYFYSRVTRSAGVNAESAVAFCTRFSTLTRDTKEEETVKAYLESDSTADNGTFYYVDMHSSVEQVMWNGLSIRNVTDPEVRITECNDVYTNMELSYSLEAGGVDADGEIDESTVETYDVREYYRVRAGFSHFYLLNFERTMEVRYEHQSRMVTASGLDLGITDPDIAISTAMDGNLISYVTGDALWQYSVTDNTLKKIFSFRKNYDNDERDTYGAHEINVLDASENGSLTFEVVGYMNSGEYEGCTGTVFYYYDAETDLVEKLAYIPGDCSGERTAAEADHCAYYDSDKGLLYTIVSGKLVELNVSAGEQQSILSGLDEMEYALSEDGRTIAWTDPDEGTVMNILKLETGEESQISSESGSYIRLMGFAGNDLLVGYGKTSDPGYDVMGNELRPVSVIEIFNSDGESVKEYTCEDEYILSCTVSGRLATVSLARRSGNVYVETGNDYISISGSSDSGETSVSVETYQDALLERCVRIAIDGISESADATVSSVKILGESRDNIIEYERTPAKRYYVYARTHLEGIYSDAGEAISLADRIYGVVVMEDGRYLWERGNRDLAYEVENSDTITLAGDGTAVSQESSLAACGQLLIDYLAIPGNVETEMHNKGFAESLSALAGSENCIELSGISVDELYYIVNRNQPAIAITGDNTGILIYGYDEEGAYVVDPASGLKGYRSNAELTAACEAGGNQFLVIIK